MDKRTLFTGGISLLAAGFVGYCLGNNSGPDIMAELSKKLEAEEARLLASSELSKTNEAPSEERLSEKRPADLLVSELARLKRYEEQLKIRANLLENALDEVAKMGEDLNRGHYSRGNKVEKLPSGLSLGGGDYPLTPVIRSRGKSSLLSRNPKTAGQTTQSLISHLDTQVSRVQNLPLGYPVSGELSSNYGWRSSPFASRSQFHQGIDISTEYDTPVRATANGLVVSAGYYGGYGNRIVIAHAGGFQTMFAHLSELNVEVGQKVCRGQQIARVGNTGRSTGPHLHYEILIDEDPLDPLPFLQIADLVGVINKAGAEATDSKTEPDSVNS